MEDLYVYLDETTSSDQHSGIAALVVDSPINKIVVSQAIAKLQTFKETTPEVKRTLNRGFFHASKDHPKAIACFMSEIRTSINGHIIYAYNGEKDNHSARGPELVYQSQFKHCLMKLANSGRPLQLYVESRGKTDEVKIRSLIEEVEKSHISLAYDWPWLPVYFPRMVINLVKKTESAEPGNQVIDSLLWSLNHDLFKLDPKKADWIKQVQGPQRVEAKIMQNDGFNAKIVEEAGLIMINSGSRFYYEGNPEFLNAYSSVSNERRRLELKNDTERLGILLEGERTIHELAKQGLPPHVNHLADECVRLSNFLKKATDTMADECIQRIARLYIRLFDTVPLYEKDKVDALIFLIKVRHYLALCLRDNLPQAFTFRQYLSKNRKILRQKSPELLGLNE